MERADLRETLDDVVRACGLVFGTITIAISLFGTWLLVVGQAHPTTVVALWMMPVLNIAWSVVMRSRAGVVSDLVRAAVCLPITTFIYIADQGPLSQLWLPSLILVVGTSLSMGIATRRSTLGVIVALAYGGALVLVWAWQSGGVDASTIDDALGIVVTGAVISLVGSRFGRTLDGLTQRTHELTTAVDRVQLETEHRRRVELELHAAHKLESVGRLAAGVAHEINTPVQFVSDSVHFVRTAVTDLFDADADPADLLYLRAHVPEALDRAVEGLGRIASIVGSMKEFAHPDTTEMTEADLDRALLSTLTMARNEYKYVADLVTDFGDLPRVRCHVGELNQAVLNIVINASHAIAERVANTDRRGTIRVTTRIAGDEVTIAIADDGAGIPVSARARIFDPFFTTKEVGRGTGQGLAIARSVVVDKHRGRITFETELGVGTTFVIHLPISAVASAAVPCHDHEHAHAPGAPRPRPNGLRDAHG